MNVRGKQLLERILRGDHSVGGGGPAAFRAATCRVHPEIPLPARMRDLPLDGRGYVVPFFVKYVDGTPDFRCFDTLKFAACLHRKLCWICGHRLAGECTFAIGPMCAINRVSSEPPSHLECARYAARVCPFLSKPRMQRNEKHLPAAATAPAGVMIRRNPGITLLWSATGTSLIRDGDGILFRIEDPTAMEWWAEGRHATREEVVESIRTGFPFLLEVATAQGPEAVEALGRMLKVALTLVAESFEGTGADACTT